MEKDYGREVDIWAVGVIWGELLYTLEENCQNPKKRKCLFPGRFCFPLSPDVMADCDENGIPLSQQNDQLEYIFNLIGTPNESDMSFVTDPKALTYLQRYPTIQPANLREKFPGGSNDALRILQSMLRFNPFDRPNVDQLLNDPYFNDVRLFSNAQNAPEEIAFAFEESDSQYLGIRQIREMFVQEIEYYKQLKLSGESQVSPSPVKNNRSQIFFNAENSYQ